MSNFSSYNPYSAPPPGAAREPGSKTAQQLRETFTHNANRISHTEQQLNDLRSLRTASRGGVMSPELVSKDHKIFLLQQQLEETRAQLMAQNERILQQQATIKHQSDAIQNPKPGNAFNTPHRREDPRQFSTGYNYQQPPPVFNLPNTTGQINQPLKSIYGAGSQYNAYGGGPSTFGPAVTQSQDLRAGTPFPPGTDGNYPTRFAQNAITQARFGNEYGSPNNAPQRVGQQLIEHSRDSSGTSPFQPTPNSGEKVPPVLPIKGYIDPAKVTDVMEQIQRVFTMTERYAWSHINTPSTAGDNALPGAVKDRLIKAATSNTAYYIMSSSQTRYFLIAKIMNQWIIKHVLKASIYKGFDADIDTNIEKAKNQIFQSTPSQVRYLYLSAIANELRGTRGRSNFNAFLHTLCRNRGNELWAIIKPLMHKKTAKDWDDLFQLMFEAHKLADLMFSGPDEYRLEFPNIGQPFEQSSMKNRDPFAQNIGPAELQASGAVVRLGVSPHITVRKNRVDGGGGAENVLSADVLVKKAE